MRPTLALSLLLAAACGSSVRPAAADPRDSAAGEPAADEASSGETSPGEMRSETAAGAIRRGETEPAVEPPTATEPSLSAVEAGTDGAGRPFFEITMAGFPALSDDGRRVAIGDWEEYGDHYVALWSVDQDRQLQRTVLAATSSRLLRDIDEDRQELERGGYRSMRRLEIEEGPCTGPICVEREGATITVRSDGAERARVVLPSRLLLIHLDGMGNCFPGGDPAPPLHVYAWTDRGVLLLKWSYEASWHGCDLPNEYRTLRLGDVRNSESRQPPSAFDARHTRVFRGALPLTAVSGD